MEEKAKIVISLSEGKFEISGSEKFVNAQIENFKELITKSVNQPKPVPQKPPTKTESVNTTQDTSATSKSNSDLDDSIYVEDDELIRIICDIPGKTKAEQTLNAALLYANARKIQGQETANVEEIKKVCANHGCLDKKNFSTHIKKGDPQLYIDKGNGGARSIKLNRPGVKKAEEIIELIKQNDK
nr:hypothetical protein [uncultured Allomuricauda sp.]